MQCVRTGGAGAVAADLHVYRAVVPAEVADAGVEAVAGVVVLVQRPAAGVLEVDVGVGRAGSVDGVGVAGGGAELEVVDVAAPLEAAAPG